MRRRGNMITMLAPSDLEIRLAAPVSDLRRRYPAWTSMPVHVTLVDEDTGYAAPLGIIDITEDGVHDYRVATADTRDLIGRFVVIILDCDHVWKPSEVYGTADTRDRTVQVFSAGTRFPS